MNPVWWTNAKQIDVVPQNGALQPIAANEQYFDGGRWFSRCVAAANEKKNEKSKPNESLASAADRKHTISEFYSLGPVELLALQLYSVAKMSAEMRPISMAISVA